MGWRRREGDVLHLGRSCLWRRVAPAPAAANQQVDPCMLFPVRASRPK